MVHAKSQLFDPAPNVGEGRPTQSTAPPKPPEGVTSGTRHRIAGLAGDGGPAADMAACHGHADSGRQSPTGAGDRGTRTPKPPGPERHNHWRHNPYIISFPIANAEDELEAAAAGVDVRRRGALAREVVCLITYLSYEQKLTGTLVAISMIEKRPSGGTHHVPCTGRCMPTGRVCTCGT